MNKQILTEWQKPCVRTNETQATCKEGEITRQGCKEAHPLMFAWLETKNKKKDRWVLVCLECQYYEELPPR